MDIKLIPVGSGAKFTFPALPEKIQGNMVQNTRVLTLSLKAQ